MEKQVYELKIDPELRDLIPPLSEEEHHMLEDSIMRDGCDTPLIVWNGTVVDGHNRYDICRNHGIPFSYEERSFADKEAAIYWMLEHQLARRNLNSYQRSELALKAKDYYTRIAQANQKAGLDLGLNSAQGGRVSEKLAKMAGVGHDTIKKAKKISENADDDTKKKLRAGEISIHRAYTDLVNKEHESETRTCERCRMEKPFTEFGIPSNRNNPRPICKDCEAKAKQAAKEVTAAAVQQGDQKPFQSDPGGNVPTSVSGMAIKDGKLAHVKVGLPDTPEEFSHVVQMLKSTQDYYVTAFKSIIEQYSPSMITQEHNDLLQSMIDSTADAIDDLFNEHIKEEE